MARIFISHSSHDNAEAVALCDWLNHEGWGDLFLDLDPHRGIAAGERWERALNEAASRCEAVLFLVSKAWLASRWCLKEFNLAHHLGKRLLGVLIEDLSVADLPADLTGTWQLVRLASGRDHVMLRAVLPVSGEEAHVTFSAEGLARLKAGLRKAGLDAKYFAWPPADDPNRPPYRGLRPLEAADAGIFFGRDGPIVEALDRLRSLREAAPPRLLVILGASGAGKSSFLRAGLIPRLVRDDRHFLSLPVVRPERAALTGESGLLASLELAFKTRNLARTRAEIRAALESGAETTRRLLNQLVKAARSPLLDDDTVAPPIIILPIDQGEELFLAEGADEAQAFLTLVKDFLTIDAPAVTALVTIRSDAYERLQLAKPLEGVRQRTFSLPPMPKGAYVEIVKEPAHRLDGTPRALKIEERLTDALLTDVEASGAKDALPLLAFTLERLYLEYGGDGNLKLSEYEQLGRVKGSIEAAVERALTATDADAGVPKDRATRLKLLRRGLIPWLAGINPDTGEPRRRVARRSEIPAEARPLIQHLVELHLLATDVAKETGEVTIEPAHDALLRQWGLLQDWLKEDSEDLATLDTVKRAAREWAANTRSNEWLAHGGGRLEEAERVAAREDFAQHVEPAERAYLAACRAAEAAARKDREAQLAIREKAQRRARWATAGVLLVGFLALAGALYQMRETAKREATVLTSLAHRAMADQRYDTAMRIALHGLPASGSSPLALGWSTPEMSGLEAKLAGAAQLSPLLRELKGHGGWVTSAAFSADGARIVTASSDRTARVWDAVSGEMLREFKGHGGTVNSAAFSADGARIVTASEDRSARVWDAASGEMLRELKGHGGAVRSAAFSADGARIVTASDDQTARVWDAASGEMLRELKGHGGAVRSAAFSADGARIVTASDDQTARVWDAVSGEMLREFKGHGGTVNSAAFSADGARIVTASADRTARVWDAASGEMLRALKGHGGQVNSAAFSGDGARIVTASDDLAARVWDAAIGEMLRELKGHDDEVSSAAFSADGARIVTASADRTARVWDAASGEMLRELKSHGNQVWSAAFSADGARVVTASWDQTARVWDAASGEMLRELKGHGGAVSSAAFSADGARIVTASEDRTARVWDAASGEMLRGLKGHGNWVTSAAFSADGARIVTASEDRTARVWDAVSGEMLRELKGHGDQVASAAFSADGARIVTASWDVTARVWDAASGEMLRELKGHGAQLTSAAFSADGARIVTASGDRTAQVWDAASGEMLREFKGHGGTVNSAAFSADGARVVTASWDQTARVWDAASGEMLRELNGHGGQVWSAAFSADGARIVTASADRTARVWDVSWGMSVRREELTRRVCAEKLVGVQPFTTRDAADPILSALAGTNPCERHDSGSAKYWIELGRGIWDWAEAGFSRLFKSH